MSTNTHSMRQIPAGMSVKDLLPAFAEVKKVVAIGTRHQQKDCACCKKPFNAARRQHQGFRLHPVGGQVAITFEYWICRACDIRYRSSAAGRDTVLAAVETFMMG